MTKGEQVLSFLGRMGAEFVAPNSYSLDVCERLNLSVAPNGISPENHWAVPTPAANRVLLHSRERSEQGGLRNLASGAIRRHNGRILDD